MMNVEFFRPLDKAAFAAWPMHDDCVPVVGDVVWLPLPDSEKRHTEPLTTTYGFKVYKRQWTGPMDIRVYIEDTAVV